MTSDIKSRSGFKVWNVLNIHGLTQAHLQVRTLCSLHVTAALAGVVTLNVHGGARHLAHAIRVGFTQEDLKHLKCKRSLLLGSRRENMGGCKSSSVSSGHPWFVRAPDLGTHW